MLQGCFPTLPTHKKIWDVVPGEWICTPAGALLPYRLLALHSDTEQFDGPGAEVSGPGVGQVTGDRVQDSPQQHTVLGSSKTTRSRVKVRTNLLCASFKTIERQFLKN